jgi:hypothetical protein
MWTQYSIKFPFQNLIFIKNLKFHDKTSQNSIFHCSPYEHFFARYILVLSGYCFFFNTRWGRLVQNFEIWLTYRALVCFLRFLGPTRYQFPGMANTLGYQYIYIYIYWTNICWVCLRAGYCKNLLGIAQYGYTCWLVLCNNLT